MLILRVVSPEPTYGYRIMQEVMEGSKEYLEVKEGSLYPALHRMEREGLLDAYWEEAGPKRRRKYYRITAKGVKELAGKQAEWQRFSAAVNGVLGITPHALA